MINEEKIHGEKIKTDGPKAKLFIESLNANKECDFKVEMGNVTFDPYYYYELDVMRKSDNKLVIKFGFKTINQLIKRVKEIELGKEHSQYETHLCEIKKFKYDGMNQGRFSEEEKRQGKEEQGKGAEENE